MSIDFNNEGPQFESVDPVAWEHRLERLRTELRNRVRELVGAIFPSARVHGSEARIGNVQGDPGESLSIGLDGDRAGLWHDHATGEGGDLITLWGMTLGAVEFPVAVQELEDWLGLGSSRPRFATRVARVSATRLEQARKAPAQDTALPPASATYHYLAPDGQTILGIVRRHDLEGHDENGKRKKTFRPQRPDGKAGMPDPRPLYKLNVISSASEVVLVEGEKCADALETLGIAATTQMGGANADPAKTDWSPLAGKSVLVWQDNDQAGDALADRVRSSLEAIGCVVRQVRIPSGKRRGWDAADAVAEGLDIPAILAKPLTASGRRKMRFLSIADLANLKPPEWLIADHIPAASFVSLYGPHGSMKSFIALDWALCIAHGRQWLGQHAVKRGAVIYVAGEGQHGLAQRILGWRDAKRESGAIDFHVLPQAVAMPTGELDEMLQLIGSLSNAPSLIVLDTLARTFGPGDENSQKDMNAFVRAVDRLREETGACVLVIHHSGKDQERGTRGSTALPGAVDTNIFVRRRGDEITLVNRAPHGKQKDAPEFEDVELRATPIRFMHQGEQVSTIVMSLNEDGSTPKNDGLTDQNFVRSGSKSGLGTNQRRVLEHLEKAAHHGRALGFTALLGMTGLDKSALGKSLAALVERDLAREIESDPRTWMFQ